MMSQGKEQRRLVKVIWQLIDDNGRIVGIFDNNLALNMIVYSVLLPENDVKQYAANVIAMNILSQFDFDGHN